MRPRPGTWRSLLALLLLVPLVWLTPLAYASPPDQTWIGGLYDDADYDDVVLLSSIRRARQEGFSPRDAIARGCEIRFRPIVVSAVVAVIGFLPAALSHGIGAEIQRPLARVVVGGLISSTLLTLLVLPAIYAWLGGAEEPAAGEVPA